MSIYSMRSHDCTSGAVRVSCERRRALHTAHSHNSQLTILFIFILSALQPAQLPQRPPQLSPSTHTKTARSAEKICTERCSRTATAYCVIIPRTSVAIEEIVRSPYLSPPGPVASSPQKLYVVGGQSDAHTLSARRRRGATAERSINYANLCQNASV